MEKIILTGGGTAGHITPNLALLPFLTDFDVHYVGEANSMEEELLKDKKQVTFHAIDSVKLIRSLSLKNLTIPFKMLSAKKKAKQLLDELKPKVIFSKGGFVALPITLAAKDIPIILHESDFSMGLANKLIVNKCKFACSSFSSVSDSLSNGVLTGSPLRQEIYLGSKQKAEKECNLISRKNLLIFGGSLGSAKINETVFSALDKLTEQFDIVHIVGKNNTTEFKKPHYFQIPFTNNIADYFAWADLCISRGGANALFELVALKKPTLIIPLPKGNSRGDQEDNAKYFEKLGYCKTLYQTELSKESLIAAIIQVDKEKNELIKNMNTAKNIDGTKKIVEIIKSCIK